jgi:hypothetical protein
LIGRLFAEAVIEAERGEVGIDTALANSSRATGRALGRQARDHAGKRPGAEALAGGVRGVERLWLRTPK